MIIFFAICLLSLLSNHAAADEFLVLPSVGALLSAPTLGICVAYGFLIGNVKSSRTLRIVLGACDNIECARDNIECARDNL